MSSKPSSGNQRYRLRFTPQAAVEAEKLSPFERPNILWKARSVHVGLTIIYPELAAFAVLEVSGNSVLIGIPEEL